MSEIEVIEETLLRHSAMLREFYLTENRRKFYNIEICNADDYEDVFAHTELEIEDN